MVTVAIPTRGRPALLRRALDSVLAQTYRNFEIVVAVDGPDPETEGLLRAEPDPRLRFHVSATQLGGGAARNAAASLGVGRWVAFLDDDDVWLPKKLERQLARAATWRVETVSFTRMIARAPHGDYLWPRRAPRPGEHISDYLFVRRSLFAGEGGIQTSTIVTSRDLLLAHPFDESLRKLQDTDWQLRAWSAGARLDFCPEPLTIWHIEEARASITAAHAANWELLLDWIGERQHLVTPRAYAAFVLVRGGAAASPGGLSAARRILRAAFMNGKPGLTEVVLFFAKWLAPASLRAALRSRFSPARVRRTERDRR
jgi:hypothetical protein